MSAELFHRAKALFLEAVDLDQAARATFLDDACAGDAELRAAVEKLLEAEHASDAHDPIAEEQPAEQIGNYKLLQPIGEGGFGSVWMAEQRHPVRRRVALKIIKLGMDTKQVIARFEAERQALALMDHPNIAKVLDAGTTDSGRPYFVMEYIRGVSIVEYCDTAKLDTNQRLRLFIQVCNAIQHAHQKGIIHRDLKPGNVLVTLYDGAPVPVIIDFGIAKAVNTELTAKTLFTAHRQLIGTPAYMSPEQAEMSGLDVDTRADIYSLGVLLYELLTGTTPFDSKSLQQIGVAEMMRVIREEEPQRPSTRLSTLGDAANQVAERRQSDPRRLGMLVRGDLDWIVMKCLEKDRTRRYETANALAADVDRHLRSVPVDAGPPSTAYQLQKFIRRHRGQVIAAAILGGALVLGIVGTSAGMIWALNEKSRADAATASERTAHKEAISERDLAIRERERADWNVYLANLGMADAAISAAGIRQAKQRLDECAPAHRGWEWQWLSARLDRSISVLTGHTRSVRACAFSPDDTMVLTASWDATARLWDAVSGEMLHELTGHGGEIEAARFSTDGAMVVTASRDGTARIWDATSGDSLVVLRGHDGPVVDTSFDHTARRVLTTSEDGTARIWSLETVNPPIVLAPPSDAVVQAAWSPGAQRVLTVSDAGRMHIWDASTGDRHLTVTLDQARISCAAFTHTGAWVLVGCDDGTASVLDAQTGDVRLTLIGHAGAISHVAVSPDNRMLLTTAGDRTVRVWDAANGSLLAVLRGHSGSIRSALFGPDNSSVLTTSSDRTARLWDIQTGRLLSLFRGHEDDVWCASFDAGGRRIVTGGFDRIARIWNASDRHDTSALIGHAEPVTAAAFDASGHRIVTTSLDGTIGIWSAMTGERLRSIPGHAGGVVSLAMAHAAGLFATSGQDDTIRLWDSSDGEQRHAISQPESPPTALAFSPDDLWLATGAADGSLHLWDVADAALEASHQIHDDRIASISFSPDGVTIATGCVDGSIRIIDARTGDLIQTIPGHDAPIACVAFDASGVRLVSASHDHSARVWDATDGTLRAELLGHDDLVLSASYAPDGERIITASRDDTVRLWDPVSGNEVGTIRGHEGAVTCARMSPDGSQLVSTSSDTTARLWSTHTYRQLCAGTLMAQDNHAANAVRDALSEGAAWTDAANALRASDDLADDSRHRALLILTILAEEARQASQR